MPSFVSPSSSGSSPLEIQPLDPLASSAAAGGDGDDSLHEINHHVAGRLVLALFAGTLFMNAALLFAVEPMFTKMVLPRLGGTPSVWNGCLLFYQAALLAGYLYAHLLSRVLAPRRQVVVHVVLLVASLMLLPVALPRDWVPDTATPIASLLRVLVLGLGGPFLLLAAGAPLLQRWFTHTGHPAASNPYFLYAASNLGSLIALLSYPVLLEPNLPLAMQSRGWAWIYGGLVALVGVCAIVTWRRAAGSSSGIREAVAFANERDVAFVTNGERSPVRTGDAVGDSAPVTLARRLRWIALALVPSSLLLGLTTYLTTDVASVPLLWVVPLALYLLTFVIAFSTRPIVPHRVALAVQPYVVVALVLVLVVGLGVRWTVAMGVHLAAFFVTALVCHGELARTRPAASKLTEFYLWISVGGALGGVFNVLLAPLLFTTAREYHVALAAACLLRPSSPSVAASASGARFWNDGARGRRVLDVVLPLLAGGLLSLALHYEVATRFARPALFAVAGVSAALVLSFRGRPVRFAFGVAALLAAGLVVGVSDPGLMMTARSFFGIYKVRQNGDFHTLTHGTTMHGAQSTLAPWTREPLTYYHREGPVGQLFANVGDATRHRSLAIVGLGTGTLACYGRATDDVTVYEIDPLVVTIARDARLFTYLRDCPPKTRVIVGDARLSLVAAPDSSIDVLLLDAFSSDAIPAHLVTREALALYLRKLRPGGVIAFHISNRYLDLKPVLAELARDARVAGAVGSSPALTPDQRRMLKARSEWVVLTRRAGDLSRLRRLSGWTVLAPSASVRVWTDDFTDVLSVFTWR